MKLMKIIVLGICLSTMVVAFAAGQDAGKCGMNPHISKMPAAPNRALITAKVLELKRSARGANEVLMRLYISKSEDIGAEINMAKTNTEIEAVAQDQFPDIHEDDVITCVVSLAGDECGQVWNVTNIKKIK